MGGHDLVQHSDGNGNVDPGELARFDALAQRWWDPEGPSRPLHDLNPVRLAYVAQRLPLPGARVLDVGCGGGLLSEAMAQQGAVVTAIDLAPELLDVARLHLLEARQQQPALQVDYLQCSAEQLAAERPGAFDAVTCMELLEHVPDPAALLRACVQLLRPGGHLPLQVLHRHFRDGLEQLMRQQRLRVAKAPRLVKGLAALPFHHIAQQRKGGSRKTDQRHPPLQLLPRQRYGVVHILHPVRRAIDAQVPHILRRPLALNHLHLQAHGLRHRQDIRKNNRRIRTDDVHRLQCNLAGQLGRLYPRKKIVLLAQCHVLREVSARLPHQPYGRPLDHLPPECAQKNVILRHSL